MTDSEREVMQSMLRSIEIAAEGFRDISKTITSVVSNLKTETDKTRDLILKLSLNATNK